MLQYDQCLMHLLRLGQVLGNYRESLGTSAAGRSQGENWFLAELTQGATEVNSEAPETCRSCVQKLRTRIFFLQIFIQLRPFKFMFLVPSYLHNHDFCHGRIFANAPKSFPSIHRGPCGGGRASLPSGGALPPLQFTSTHTHEKTNGILGNLSKL